MTTVLIESSTVGDRQLTQPRLVVNHYVMEEQITAGIVFGTPAVALCGECFVPSAEGDGQTSVSGAALCPRCRERQHLADLQRWRWEAALTLLSRHEAEAKRRVRMVPVFMLDPWVRSGESFTLVLERDGGGYTPYRGPRTDHFPGRHHGDVVKSSVDTGRSSAGRSSATKGGCAVSSSTPRRANGSTSSCRSRPTSGSMGPWTKSTLSTSTAWPLS